jgi:pyrimidine-nucleoside phosphorylase
MNIIDVIDKKRIGKELTREELDLSFNGYLRKEVEDYQMSALLMAICINGMSDQEIFDLTDLFINSGETLNLASIPGIKVDKHSTGGVGDKTTLIIAPIVASLGVIVPKMSGRGLGLTGGTIDKLESIPGFNVNLTLEEFMKELNDVGMVVCSQTDKLTPLDKAVYALRDVTGTVSSIPLIATSIMSKKIASGADKILIDIKVGSGALIKNENDAKALKDLMIRIGNKYDKEVRCIISDMNVPLGYAVGNALEVGEAAEILEGNIKNNLYDLCIDIASNMVSMGNGMSIIDARAEVLRVLQSGEAYNKFIEFIEYQHGVLEDMEISDETIPIVAEKSGVITKIDAYKISEVSCKLGAGKLNIEDEIDHSVGVLLNKQVGDKVEIGDTICTLYVHGVKEIFDIADAFTIEEEEKEEK